MAGDSSKEESDAKDAQHELIAEACRVVIDPASHPFANYQDAAMRLFAYHITTEVDAEAADVMESHDGAGKGLVISRRHAWRDRVLRRTAACTRALSHLKEEVAARTAAAATRAGGTKRSRVFEEFKVEYWMQEMRANWEAETQAEAEALEAELRDVREQISRLQKASADEDTAGAGSKDNDAGDAVSDDIVQMHDAEVPAALRPSVPPAHAPPPPIPLPDASPVLVHAATQQAMTTPLAHVPGTPAGAAMAPPAVSAAVATAAAFPGQPAAKRPRGGGRGGRPAGQMAARPAAAPHQPVQRAVYPYGAQAAVQPQVPGVAQPMGAGPAANAAARPVLPHAGAEAGMHHPRSAVSGTAQTPAGTDPGHLHGAPAASPRGVDAVAVGSNLPQQVVGPRGPMGVASADGSSEQLGHGLPKSQPSVPQDEARRRAVELVTKHNQLRSQQQGAQRPAPAGGGMQGSAATLQYGQPAAHGAVGGVMGQGGVGVAGGLHYTGGAGVQIGGPHASAGAGSAVDGGRQPGVSAAASPGGVGAGGVQGVYGGAGVPLGVQGEQMTGPAGTWVEAPSAPASAVQDSGTPREAQGQTHMQLKLPTDTVDL